MAVSCWVVLSGALGYAYRRGLFLPECELSPIHVTEVSDQPKELLVFYHRQTHVHPGIREPCYRSDFVIQWHAHSHCYLRISFHHGPYLRRALICIGIHTICRTGTQIPVRVLDRFVGTFLHPVHVTVLKLHTLIDIIVLSMSISCVEASAHDDQVCMGYPWNEPSKAYLLFGGKMGVLPWFW